MNPVRIRTTNDRTLPVQQSEFIRARATTPARLMAIARAGQALQDDSSTRRRSAAQVLSRASTYGRRAAMDCAREAELRRRYENAGEP